MAEMSAYINAGGKGTRLETVLPTDFKNGIAKALLKVGKPAIALVDHHINKLLDGGIEKIVVGAAHQYVVADYIDQRYENEDRVVASRTMQQLGSGAELRVALTEMPSMFDESIYICNVDTVLDISEEDFYKFHKLGSKALSIALTNNKGVPNEGAYYLDTDRHVIFSAESSRNYIGHEHAETICAERGSSTGAVILDNEYVRFLILDESQEEISLYRHVVGAAVCMREVSGYDNQNNFFIDLGTPATWLQAMNTQILEGHLCY